MVLQYKRVGLISFVPSITYVGESSVAHAAFFLRLQAGKWKEYLQSLTQPSFSVCRRASGRSIFSRSRSLLSPFAGGQVEGVSVRRARLHRALVGPPFFFFFSAEVCLNLRPLAFVPSITEVALQRRLARTLCILGFRSYLLAALRR
jgi:hypothetical protein